MAAERIGACKCPLCGGRASLTLSKSQLAVVTCNGCNFQGFTRSDRSDELLRARRIPDAAPAAPAPAPAPAPAAPAPAAPAAPVAPPPKPAAPAWRLPF